MWKKQQEGDKQNLQTMWQQMDTKAEFSVMSNMFGLRLSQVGCWKLFENLNFQRGSHFPMVLTHAQRIQVWSCCCPAAGLHVCAWQMRSLARVHVVLGAVARLAVCCLNVAC